jgi:hypothetical protein
MPSRFMHVLAQFWSDDSQEDVRKYSVRLAVLLVVVVCAIKIIGRNADLFFQIASWIQ